MITLVTGATGFVGINIVEALLARGDEVIAFGQAPLPEGAHRAFAQYGSKLHVILGDVRDGTALDQLFTEHRVECLVHGAAITAGVDRETRDPDSIIDVNVRGTVRVVQSAHEHGVRRMVYVSSGSAYGESLFTEQRLYEDVTPARPATLYQITKHAAERTALRLRAVWGLDLVCVRLGSVIGPWERDTGVRDTLSPHFQLARLAAAGQNARLPAREGRKDLVYSRDVAAGIVALLNAPALRYTLYNLSSGRSGDWHGTLVDWCGHLQKVYPGFEFRTVSADEPHDIFAADKVDRAPMDIGRIVQDAGFRPAYGPAEAYADMVDWLRQQA